MIKRNSFFLGILVLFVFMINSQVCADDLFLNEIARDTWNYLESTTTKHLPWSWKSDDSSGGDYCNPAEIGLLALSYIAVYDLSKEWSPEWGTVETEVIAILNQLRAWQTNKDNSYEYSVFYQGYWISKSPPVVGNVSDDNHYNQVVPSIDNAWLAACLMTIMEYAKTHNHSDIHTISNDILNEMDFTMWYNFDTHKFYWGAYQDPKNGGVCDYYSNENRITNFIAAALGQLSLDEFHLSIDALEKPTEDYDQIKVENVAWDGSIFTYFSPALFINEKETSYATKTLEPIVETQIKYALNESYDAWGLSDCFGVGNEGYTQQGAFPIPSTNSNLPETIPGLVSPHASAFALNTPFFSNAIDNLKQLKNNFPLLYNSNGFKDSVVVLSDSPNYGDVSNRFSALAQQWILLSIANKINGFIWNYFYENEGVSKTHDALFNNTRKVTFISPLGTINDTTPSYTWYENFGATWYKLFVWNNSKEKIHSQWYESSGICSEGKCSVQLDSSLKSGNYECFVKSWNEHGNTWSEGMSFAIQGDDTPPSKVTHTSPSGAIQTSTPAFTWTADPASTWYRLWIGYPGDIKILGKWYEASTICSDDECSVGLELDLSNGDYEWYIKSWNSSGKVWSDGMVFTITK